MALNIADLAEHTIDAVPDRVALICGGETLTYGGVPELADAGGGRIRLYVCARGIESYLSADGGATWQREAVIATAPPPQRIICDPSRIAGTNLFLYKTGD